MLNLVAGAAFAFAVQPAAAAPMQPPEPPPAFIAAAQGFGQCIQSGAISLPASVTPEAGATQLLAGCSQQRTALETQFEGWVSGPNFPEAGRTIAREQFRSQLGQAEAMIASQIRQSRAAPGPSATPAPTPPRQ